MKSGQLGHRDFRDYNSPKQVEGFSHGVKPIQISTAQFHTCVIMRSEDPNAVKSGTLFKNTLYSWGHGSHRPITPVFHQPCNKSGFNPTRIDIVQVNHE